MKKQPLVSIITVVLNSKDYINFAIESVLSQSYENIEYIIIDGGSKDGTMDIINSRRDRINKFISEPDKGIYDAMNKGIGLASGKIVGILNSDDFYKNEKVIETAVREMENKNVDICWGDLVYVNKKNINKTIRYWKSSEYQEGKFQKGWAPPHPSFFVKKIIYEKYGNFRSDFFIAADYEIMLRFLKKYKIKSCYIPEVFVKMRTGGKSNRSFSNIKKGALECYKAWNVNGFKITPFIPVIIRPLMKIKQYFNACKIANS